MTRLHEPENKGTDTTVPRTRAPYEAPRLSVHGTVAGLTRAYLQGKLPGTKDASQSGRGRA